MTLKIDIDFKRKFFKLKLKLNLELPLNGTTIIMGESGSGKTTLLRCLAGLEKSKGTIQFQNKVWQDSAQKIFMPTHKRNLGYVFQHANLFPHLTVKENLNYALKRSQAKYSLHDLPKILNIYPLREQYPHELSGGEKQLVAIVRALLIGPEILFMDEPVSSLDRHSKENVLCVVEEVQKAFSIPILYVTHSDGEGKRLGTNFVHMEKLKI